MYRGTDIIDGAKEFVDYLLEQQMDFVFFTNNSSRTPKQAKEHMEKIGFENILEKHFFTSAMASAMYIKYPMYGK
jgi:4-nitrophenyl phosphatase